MSNKIKAATIYGGLLGAGGLALGSKIDKKVEARKLAQNSKKLRDFKAKFPEGITDLMDRFLHYEEDYNYRIGDKPGGLMSRSENKMKAIKKELLKYVTNKDIETYKELKNLKVKHSNRYSTILGSLGALGGGYVGYKVGSEVDNQRK